MATGDTAVWLDLEKFSVNLVHKLGQGSFGIVYMGKDARKGTPVAVKEVKLEDEQKGGDAMREIKNLLKLPTHENIVCFLDFHFSRNAIWMVMEYCDMGDLQGYYKKYKPIHIATNVSFMCQIAAAIAHMHSLPEPIVHRDLKPANIMLKYCTDKPLIKITDFGLAKVAANDPMSTSKTFLMTTKGGTPGYMAPELFGEDKYSASVDVFAMGFLMLGMLNYEDDPDMLPVVEFPDMPMVMPVGIMMNMARQMGKTVPNVVNIYSSDGAVTKSLKQVFAKMVAVEPKDRIKSSEAKQKLATIYASIASTLPCPPPGPVPESGPSEDGDHSSESESNDSDGGLADHLGYLLLQQAAKQHMEEQLRRRKSEAAEAAMEELAKGIPLLELLRQRLVGSDEEQDEAKAHTPQSPRDKLAPGDRVRIDDCGGDVGKAKGLQENYGGWNDKMKPYLGRTGVVQNRILHIVKVKFSDGGSWSFNPALVKKLDSDGNVESTPDRAQQRDKDYSKVVQSLFKRYEIVMIPEDEEVVKLLQKNHGGWNDKMKLSLGLKALVNRVDKDGDVFVECINGHDWVFNPELLVHVKISEDIDIEPGDFVLVMDDINYQKKIHEKCGGWSEEMSKATGHTGIVKELLGGDRVSLECRRTVLAFHKKGVKLVAKGEEMLVAILRRRFGE